VPGNDGRLARGTRFAGYWVLFVRYAVCGHEAQLAVRYGEIRETAEGEGHRLPPTMRADEMIA
jgi:hypothetical protein